MIHAGLDPQSPEHVFQKAKGLREIKVLINLLRDLPGIRRKVSAKKVALPNQTVNPSEMLALTKEEASVKNLFPGIVNQ